MYCTCLGNMITQLWWRAHQGATCDTHRLEASGGRFGWAERLPEQLCVLKKWYSAPVVAASPPLSCHLSAIMKSELPDSRRCSCHMTSLPGCPTQLATPAVPPGAPSHGTFVQREPSLSTKRMIIELSCNIGKLTGCSQDAHRMLTGCSQVPVSLLACPLPRHVWPSPPPALSNPSVGPPGEAQLSSSYSRPIRTYQLMCRSELHACAPPSRAGRARTRRPAPPCQPTAGSHAGAPSCTLPIQRMRCIAHPPSTLTSH